jgi:Tol biopolymer transport system component
MKKILFLFISLISSLNSIAQKTPLPSTDIYLLPITSDKNGIIQVGDGIKITDWNGYNNQPSFSPDDKKILYTSIQVDSQADIYSYDISAKKTSRIIYIKSKKEYSALFTQNGKSISAVQVQEDDSTQYLAEFSKGGQFKKIIFPKINPVGYYCWASDTSAALFVLGKIFTLQIANTNTGKATTVAQNIGRCIQKIPNTPAISFVDKTDSTNWMIKSYVPAIKQFLVIGYTKPKCEDYCWMNDGTILMGYDGKLFAYNPAASDKDDRDWVQVADFSNTPYANFYRLAISHDGKWLAVVSYKGKKP